MKLVVKGDVKVKCSKCDEVNVIDVKDFDYEAVSSDERGMGKEVCYSAHYETSCSKCENEISVDSDIYEYPEGAVNDDSNNNSYIEIDGGTRISSDIEAHFEDGEC